MDGGAGGAVQPPAGSPVRRRRGGHAGDPGHAGAGLLQCEGGVPDPRGVSVGRGGGPVAGAVADPARDALRGGAFPSAGGGGPCRRPSQGCREAGPGGRESRRVVVAGGRSAGAGGADGAGKRGLAPAPARGERGRRRGPAGADARDGAAGALREGLDRPRDRPAPRGGSGFLPGGAGGSCESRRRRFGAGCASGGGRGCSSCCWRRCRPLGQPAGCADIRSGSRDARRAPAPRRCRGGVDRRGDRAGRRCPPAGGNRRSTTGRTGAGIAGARERPDPGRGGQGARAGRLERGESVRGGTSLHLAAAW